MEDLVTWDQLTRIMPVSLVVMTIAAASVWGTLKVIQFTLDNFRDRRKREDD